MVEQQVQQRKKKSPTVNNPDYGREMIESNPTFNPAIPSPDDDWRQIDEAVIQQQSRERETVQSKIATGSSLSLSITPVALKKARDNKKGKTLLMGEDNFTHHHIGTTTHASEPVTSLTKQAPGSAMKLNPITESQSSSGEGVVLVKGNQTLNTSNQFYHIATDTPPPEETREEGIGEGLGKLPDHPAQIAPPITMQTPGETAILAAPKEVSSDESLSVETANCLALKTFPQHSGILGGLLAKMIANSAKPKSTLDLKTNRNHIIVTT